MSVSGLVCWWGEACTLLRTIALGEKSLQGFFHRVLDSMLRWGSADPCVSR